MAEITGILEAIDEGHARAAEELLPLVYDELRRLAAQRLSREKPGQTLQATALVHEAYIRLVESGRLAVPDDADPEFRRRVSTVRGQLMDAAAGRLADGATEAADVLREILDSDADSTRLTAARAILQQSVALRDATELEQRIKQLEDGVDGNAAKTHRIA